MTASWRVAARRLAAAVPLVCVLLLAGSQPALPVTTYEEHVLFLGHAARDDASSPPGLLVRRDDGDDFLLTVGRGCGRLTEGRRVALREELDDGERLAFVQDPGSEASCSVYASKAVTIVDDAPPPASSPPVAEADELEAVVRALQGGLEILGYEPGPIDGEVGPETARALMKYRTDKRHDRGGLDLRFTIWTLGMDVLVMKPYDEGAFEIADTLIRTSEK